VIATEGACADDGGPEWGRIGHKGDGQNRLLAGDRGETAFVEVQQLADLVFSFVSGGRDEAGGLGAGLGDLRRCSDEFQ
jgi:hypothetical protein